jgi:hypothetical protein
MASTPESKVKSAIKAWLKAHGAYVCMPATGGYGRSGAPDFLTCIGGWFVAIEAKAPGKRANTTAMQDQHIVEIHQAGGIAIIVDDVTQLDQLEIYLGRVPV